MVEKNGKKSTWKYFDGKFKIGTGTFESSTEMRPIEKRDPSKMEILELSGLSCALEGLALVSEGELCTRTRVAIVALQRIA